MLPAILGLSQRSGTAGRTSATEGNRKKFQILDIAIRNMHDATRETRFTRYERQVTSDVQKCLEFSNVSPHFSKIFKRFTQVFERFALFFESFQTFSNVSIVPVLPNPYSLTPSPLILPQKLRLPLKSNPFFSPFPPIPDISTR